MKDLRNVIASNLNEYVTEKLILNHSTKQEYKYHPQNWDELRGLLKRLLDERGEDADLNDIDVSGIDDMSQLFFDLGLYVNIHNINISEWDVSNVKNMYAMFFGL